MYGVLSSRLYHRCLHDVPLAVASAGLEAFWRRGWILMSFGEGVDFREISINFGEILMSFEGVLVTSKEDSNNFLSGVWVNFRVVFG